MLKTSRSNRWNRSRRRYHENDFDISFDWNKPLDQSCYIILNHINSKDALNNKSQLLAYLNLFIKYCLYRYGKAELPNRQDNSPNDQNVIFKTFSDEEILCCLRISLFHEVAEVRAATLRAIRYFVQNKRTLNILLKLNLQQLIARSLDLILENRVERIQAIRLIRHILIIEPKVFPIAFGRCLCSISHDNLLEDDVLLRVCWATIAELTVVNAILSARSGCINILVRCALNSVTGLNSSSEFDDKNRNSTNVTNLVNDGTINNFTIPFTNIAISEAILSSFVHLYNFPDTRKLLQPNGSDLFYFISPFTDLYSFYHTSQAFQEQKELNHFKLVDHHSEEDHHPHKFDLNKNRPNLNKLHNPSRTFMNREQRTLRYLACKNAILSILRSWPGFFFMCRVIKFNKQSKRLHSNSLAHIVLQENDLILPWKLIQKVGINSCLMKGSGLDRMNALESLVSILHLPYAEVHHHLLDMFYEIFGIRCPESSENFDEALKCTYFNYHIKQSKTSSTNLESNAYFPDEWQLYDGFVAKEAEDILPSLSSSRLNFITNYQALLLQSLVEFGLLEALISMILDSCDQSIINLATILTGELLYLSGKMLPPSLYAHRCHSLPTLVSASISSTRELRNRALKTITNFNRIYDIKKQKSPPASLFLEQQAYFCQNHSHNTMANTKYNLSRPHSASFLKMQEENVLSSIKNSLVLRKNSYRDWNWDIIADLLKQPHESMRKLEDKDVRSFTSRLLEFFLPSKRQFSSISKNSGIGSSDATTPTSPSPIGRYEVIYFDNPRLICTVAIYFLEFLLHADETKSSEFIKKFILDLEDCLKNVSVPSPSVEEVFIPSRLMSTLSHHYFLLLGRLTHFPNGRSWLEKTNIYQYLINLVDISTNEVYAKLIVTSFDYSEANFSRSILGKVLTCPLELSRLYATKFMRVLLRLRQHDFCKWGLDLLIEQLYDKSYAVSFEALDILDEACSENSEYLDKVLSRRPSLLNLGDKGIVFITRYASNPSGIRMLEETSLLKNEIDRWRSHFCLRYVRLVEDSLNECFSCHQKGNSGKYGRRSDKRHFLQLKSTNKAAFLLPHLYGQLVQCSEGFQIVIENSLIEETVQIIEEQIKHFLPADSISDHCDGEETTLIETNPSPSDLDILKMKSALWAISHLASSEVGIDQVIKCSPSFMYWLTLLIENSPILSIRFTGFHAICLIASTRKGSEILNRYGWIALQHSHHDNFPIDKQEFEYFHMPYSNKYGGGSTESEKNIKSIVSIPSSNFSLFSDDNLSNIHSHSTYQNSLNSSSSDSSSYLSILPSEQRLLNNDNKSQKSIINRTESEKLSSSSAHSLYSNTSSVGSLMTGTNIHLITTTANTDPRIRSSSDCVSGSSAMITSNKLSESKKSKPELKDSGIVDQSSCLNSNKNDRNYQILLNRNRKISAPCFPSSTMLSNHNDGKSRSGSNDSTALYVIPNDASRSTSFTEYSTTSSCNSNNQIDHQSNKNSSILQPKPNSSPAISKQQSKGSRQSLIDGFGRSVDIPDDSFPSSIDAYGYAQLRAIQKRRMESLTGNLSLNFGTNCSNNNNFLETSSNHTNIEPLITNTVSKNDENSKNSRVISPLHHTQMDHLEQPLSKRRSLSGSSQISSELEIGLIENVSLSSNSNHQNVQSLSSSSSAQESRNFMCLCLPKSLSLIFQLNDEDHHRCTKLLNQNSKDTNNNNKKKVKFPSEPQKSFKKPKVRFDLNEEECSQYFHNESKCLNCCVNSILDIDIPENSLKSEITSEGNHIKQEISFDNDQNSNMNDELMNNINKLSSSITNNNKDGNKQEVLRLVSNLTIAMYAKQAEQELLSCKQKYPQIFDFCLYSDVCIQMENYNFKASARRFLHELFLDINSDPFYFENQKILKKFEIPINGPEQQR